VIGLGGLQIADGAMTVGMLVAFQTLMASFAQPAAELARLGGQMQQVQAFTARLDDIEGQPLDRRFAADAETRPVDALPRGRIQLEGVAFGYAPLEAPIIEDLDLSAAPGARIALVGSSGSGKSTVGRLIAGLQRPRAGRILLDGRPLDAWPPAALAARLAYVEQDVGLFEGTVRDNLTLWDATIAEADVVAAARDAQIHDAIAARPGAYEAVVEEGGRNFSGGQRQRLDIARALARNPSIIVLDEATSALDPTVEAAVMDAIRRRGATCIVIAHRLSAIRDCDEIVVLERGRIVERGRHEELLLAGGRYAALLEA
jgi:ABC-type bacteriocin/lantibiotic exporter with double-glycine peptidase domain